MSVCCHVLCCKNRNRSRIGFEFREALIHQQLCVSIVTDQISFRHSWSRSCVGVLVSRAFLQHTYKPFEFSTRRRYTIPIWVEWLRVKEDRPNLTSNGCVSTAVRLKRLKWLIGFNLSQRLKRLKWRIGFNWTGQLDSWSIGPGFESRQERRDNFLLQSQLSVLTLISVSVPPQCYHSST